MANDDPQRVSGYDPEILERVNRVLCGDIDSDLQRELDDPTSDLAKFTRSFVAVAGSYEPVDWDKFEPIPKSASLGVRKIAAIAAVVLLSMFVIVFLLTSRWRQNANQQLTRLESTYLDTLRDAKNGVVTLDAVADLRKSPRETLGNGRPADYCTLLEPLATKVDSGRPTFRWRVNTPAEEYVVYVFNNKSTNESVESVALPGNMPRGTEMEWTIPLEAPALRPGDKYSWQVESTVSGEKFSSPGRTSPMFLFVVLDNEMINAVKKFETRNQLTAFQRGCLYVSVGLLNDALREFESIPSTQSDYLMTQPLIKQLHEHFNLSGEMDVNGQRQ